MSKTYEALVKAEKLRAAQDPAALARRVARTAEESETLRAELRVCEEQLTALGKRLDAAADVDDDLGRQLARLALQQERLAAEPRQLLETAIHQLKEDVDRRWTALRSQSDQAASLSSRLEQAQQALAPALEAIRRDLDELRRRADELQRSQQSERQTLAATVNSLREAVANATSSVDEQQRAHQQLAAELAAVHAAQQESARQSQRLAVLSESFASVSGRLANIEALRHADSDDLHSDVRKVQEGIDRLRNTLAEADSASASASAHDVEALRAELEALREQLTSAGGGTPSEEPTRAHPEHAPPASAQAMAGAQDSVDSLQAAQREMLERLATIEEAQTRSDGRAHDLLRTLEPLRSGHTQSAHDIETLREQLATLFESVGQVQGTAEEAARRTTALDETHASRLAVVQQRIVALQTEGGALRDALQALQAALTEQRERTTADFERVHSDVAALVKAQARQDEIAAAVGRAQAAADEAARRISANEEAQSSALTALREQLATVQADSSSWSDVSIGVQSVMARQQAAAGEVDGLRAQVARMLEAQQRQQQLFEELLLAPANSDEPLAAADSADSPDLAGLRRQVVALQADRLKLDAFLETRFEVLCEIVDAEMQAKLDELRAGGGSFAPGRLLGNRISRTWARLSSWLARQSKKID